MFAYNEVEVYTEIFSTAFSMLCFRSILGFCNGYSCLASTGDSVMSFKNAAVGGNVYA